MLDAYFAKGEIDFASEFLEVCRRRQRCVVRIAFNCMTLKTGAFDCSGPKLKKSCGLQCTQNRVLSRGCGLSFGFEGSPGGPERLCPELVDAGRWCCSRGIEMNRGAASVSQRDGVTQSCLTRSEKVSGVQRKCFDDVSGMR